MIIQRPVKFPSQYYLEVGFRKCLSASDRLRYVLLRGPKWLLFEPLVGLEG